MQFASFAVKIQEEEVLFLKNLPENVEVLKS